MPRFEIELPPPFPTYEVEGVGTVIAHVAGGTGGYHVRTADGRVIGFPAQSGYPCEANAAADIAYAVAHPPAPTPPASVTRRQLFLWLNSSGVTRAQIRGMLTGNEEALIEFEEALEFRRDHPLVAQLGAALGLTSAQVDAGFRAAAAL